MEAEDPPGMSRGPKNGDPPPTAGCVESGERHIQPAFRELKVRERKIGRFPPLSMDTAKRRERFGRKSGNFTRCDHTLKLADVRPLFKSGDPDVPKNYHPVSFLPIVSKVLERIVHSRLSRFLASHALLPPAQFAYRAEHSTEDAVTLAVDWYLEAADHQLHTGIVLVDMSKVFDKINTRL